MLCCCNMHEQTSLYDAGVSRELAQHRKESISNVEYKMYIDIPETESEPVEGYIDVNFVIGCPQEIILDFREEGNIKEVWMNGNRTRFDVRNEHIILPESSCKRGLNNIAVSFIAGNQSLNRKEDFLYTLLVPDRARTVFPCFDQPDMKATFKLTLEIPEKWIAVSNTSINEILEYNGRKTITFNPTEKLSTYLFSFVTGEFKTKTYNNGRHSFAAYYRETDPQRVGQLPIIFEQVAQSLEWLEEYTGIPYPFAKYDFIILPGFQFSGMEHTGATLYNDLQLFLGKHPTPDEELRRAQLIAHETAHMWFGDYVTMEWFDDVWTKEVFANYFSMRMTEPMFPGINHRLNWLKSIVTPSLSEDRTYGGTAIKQPLDNMRNAGLVYNNIIYNKAPVMLEKLIELMGEEAFREGIHEYLTKHAYSNASWQDLIEILDARSDKRLTEFSNVWVNSNGMPHFSFDITGDTLEIRQKDPYGRGLLWQQKFRIAVIGNGTREVEAYMSDTIVKIAVGNDAQYILPNSDGRGYGYFSYDTKSLAWALHNWHNIADETNRQAQLMNLHECFQHNVTDAVTWLRSLIAGLEKEKNALAASTICNYIGKPLQEAKDPAIEEYLMQLAETHPIKSCRLRLTRTLISSATSPAIHEKMYDIWEKMSHPMLNENDYMTLAYELAIRMPERYKEITEIQCGRIKDPDRKAQFEFISRAVTPDTLEQDKLFRSLLIAENRRIEPWALKTLGYLCHPLREEQAIRYIRPALDSLKEIQRTSDIFFPQSWARTLLRERHTQEAMNEIDRFFNDNPDYSPLLKSKILHATWSLQRVTGNN